MVALPVRSRRVTFFSYVYTAVFCLGIGLLLWALGDQQDLVRYIGVSLCIGMSIMVAFHVLQTPFERFLSPVFVPIPIVAVGLCVGLFLGGSLFVGKPWFYFSEEWSSLMLGVFFGIVGYLMFGARERLAGLRAQLAEQEALRLAQEKQLAETQLKLLQAQIEPHFLFNTLSNIAGMIRTSPSEAEQTLLNLTTLLRSTLKRTRQNTTTLGEELDIINAYLQIQKIRMKDRLQFEICVDPDLRDRPLAPMLLQPLVENALKHGVDPLEEGGRVMVSVEQRDEGVVARVEDTGQGINTYSPGTGTGLANIRERLVSLYDGKAHLDLVENEPHGVVATLYLPDERLPDEHLPGEPAL
jgi:signal transduction histidine kinase